MEAEQDLKGQLLYPEIPADSAPQQYRWFQMEKVDDYREPWFTDSKSRDWILVEWKPKDYAVRFLRGDELESIEPTRGSRMEHLVRFVFKAKSRNAFGNFTERFKEDVFSNSDPRRLCVIFNEKVFWAGTIRSRIEGIGIMEGFKGASEQMEMVNILKAGSMPVRLKLVEQKEYHKKEKTK